MDGSNVFNIYRYITNEISKNKDQKIVFFREAKCESTIRSLGYAWVIHVEHFGGRWLTIIRCQYQMSLNYKIEVRQPDHNDQNLTKSYYDYKGTDVRNTSYKIFGEPSGKTELHRNEYNAKKVLERLNMRHQDFEDKVGEVQSHEDFQEYIDKLNKAIKLIDPKLSIGWSGTTDNKRYNVYYSAGENIEDAIAYMDKLADGKFQKYLDISEM